MNPNELKSAEDIVNTLETYNSVSEQPMVCISKIALISTIKQELVNAYRAGMTDAAEIAKDCSEYPDAQNGAFRTQKAILSARDRKENL